MFKHVLLTGAAVSALALAAAPARADNIVLDQWYTGNFGATPNTALLGGPFSGTSALLGTNGPTLTNPNHGALAAPSSSGVFTAIVTVAAGGYVTFTDVEDSGDQFNIQVNGAAATPYGDSALTPAGQAGLANGDTSSPNSGDYVDENIGNALSDGNFSSGTFYLPAGTDTITGTFLGGVGNGDFDMIAEAPEPGTLSVLGLGAVALGLFRRRRRS